jgi:hypothetical protein
MISSAHQDGSLTRVSDGTVKQTCRLTAVTVSEIRKAEARGVDRL